MNDLDALPDRIPALDRPPLTLAKALRGHVVVLAFWRIGCRNSVQSLAELAALPASFPGAPLAVVGVHVATQPAERDRRRVRRAVAAWSAPVTILLDERHDLVDALSIEALPSLGLFDARGILRFTGKGEPDRDRLRTAIEALLALADEGGHAARVPFVPASPARSTALCPTAVCASGDAAWVAASGRDVVLVDADGTVRRRVASPGEVTGLCEDEARLFASVAGRHEVLALERGADRWRTVLGNGRRSMDRHGGGFGSDQGLCSPAGLFAREGVLYVAQAGAHQIWECDPETGAGSAWIGSGERALRDGGSAAAFAEPIGLSGDDEGLLVADAGSGSVRSVEFGHRFALTIAKGLSRPVGVASRGDRLLVLDGWRPALLSMPRHGGDPEVLYGAADGLVDPVAMACSGGMVWIADPGAGALFVGDLEGPSSRLRRIEWEDGEVPPAALCSSEAAARVAEPIAVAEFSDVELRLPLPGFDGTGTSEPIQCEIDIVEEEGEVLAVDRHTVEAAAEDHVVVLLPIAACGRGVLRIRVRAEFSGSRSTWHYLLPVEVGPTGAPEVELRPATASITP